MKRAPSEESLYNRAYSRLELNKKLLKVAALTAFICGSLLFLTLASKVFTRKTDLREIGRNQALEYYSRTHRSQHYKSKNLFRTKQDAVLVILCRNEDLEALLNTLRNFEFQYNRKHRYPYVLLNNVPFTEKFKKLVSKLINGLSSADVKFGLIPHEHWSYPAWIDQELAAENRKSMQLDGVIYGGSESYRHMCRYFSGFFHHHPLLQSYEYYWRIEPGVTFLCNIPFDPFEVMHVEGKKYGFVITFEELPKTVPTLWEKTNQFIEQNGHMLAKNNCLDYFKRSDGDYNLCHFWSNFEIGSFKFLRSPEYQAYFDYLDRQGGFFYERWGDAPIHSLAVGMFLSKEQVAYFEDIGYRHNPFAHCPVDSQWRRDNNCACNPFFENDQTHSACQLSWNRFRTPEESGEGEPLNSLI